MLGIFFTIVYFICFFHLINFVANRTLGMDLLSNLLCIVCWVIAYIVSVVLSDYTLKKIEAKYSKK